MDSWLTFEGYSSRYPGSALTEAQFAPLAQEAAIFIENGTHWGASLARSEEELALLADCQAQLVHLAEGINTGWDGVTSVNNHGYTESYASGMDVQRYLGQQQTDILYRTLSAPPTRWLLWAGSGVFRPRRR